MPAFDVDFFGGGGVFNPERDRVTFNGHVVPTEFLQGDNNIWVLNDFTVPIEWVKFPTDPGKGGTASPVDNTVQIDVDTANSQEVWCTAIDWASLNIKAARPVVFVHGIFSDGSAWTKAGFSWVDHLNSLGLPNSNALSMGPLNSIADDAQKIATEVAADRKRWGVDKVNIVAHSKGGLDSREYVENNDGVDQLIQLGTPNAGSPLADAVQLGSLLLLGLPNTVLINGLAGPGGIQLTTPYMAAYNAFHGANSNVRYTALAGDYDPGCAFCHPVESLLLAITGRGDTIVPVSSVHALSYTTGPEFASTGTDKQATHTELNASAGVYDKVRGQVEAPNASTSSGPPIARAANTVSKVATIGQGQEQHYSLPIDQATPSFFSLMFPSGNLALTLTSPSGRVFTSTAPPAGAAYEQSAIPGGMADSFSLAAPEVGLWGVDVTAPVVTEPSGMVTYSLSAWLTQPALTLQGSAVSLNVHSGQPLHLRTTLRAGANPVKGATVTAKIVGPDNAIATVALLDDGKDDDAVAGDGVYSASFSGTALGGTYRIAYSGTRSATSGQPAFSREAFALATVSHSASSLAGTFSDSGVDTNANGLFDDLALKVDVSVTAPGTYRLIGTIADSAGNTHEASTSADLMAGQRSITLQFPGKDLFDAGVDGPYKLTSVRLAEQTGPDLLALDERVDAYQTHAYSFRQFEHPPVILTGLRTSQGIDTNGDGLFDILRVTIGVNVAHPGTFTWSARLNDPNGNKLAFSSNQASFSAGDNSLTLDFDGNAIGAACQDGPYQVGDLLVFGGGDSLVAPDGFTTAKFTASQFQGSSSCRTATTTTYTGDTTIVNGGSATLSGRLTTTSSGAAPVARRTLKFTLGAGASAQTCNATTDTAGSARCIVDPVNQSVTGGSPPVPCAGQDISASTTCQGLPITATFAGDNTYLPSFATATATIATFGCSVTVSGTVAGNLITGLGTTCLRNASVSGTVIAAPSSALVILGSTIGGSLSSRGATSLTVCASTISGTVSITGATGFVLIGAGADASAPCGANTIDGAVNLGVTGPGNANTGGVELGGNSVKLSVVVIGNVGATSGTAEDKGLEIEANRIGGVLVCTQNAPPPVNDHQPNVAVATGQCAGLLGSGSASSAHPPARQAGHEEVQLAVDQQVAQAGGAPLSD